MKKEIDPFDVIKKELSNYDTSVLVEFMNKFPPTTRTYFLPIYEIGKIKPLKIIIKNRQVGPTTSYLVNTNVVFNPNTLASVTWLPSFLTLPKCKITEEYIIFGSVDDFWKRWNRFKNLIAFL